MYSNKKRIIVMSHSQLSIYQLIDDKMLENDYPMDNILNFQVFPTRLNYI